MKQGIFIVISGCSIFKTNFSQLNGKIPQNEKHNNSRGVFNIFVSEKTNEPDAIGEVGTQSDPTLLKPTFSRHELGAGLANMKSYLEKSNWKIKKNGKNPSPDPSDNS